MPATSAMLCSCARSMTALMALSTRRSALAEASLNELTVTIWRRAQRPSCLASSSWSSWRAAAALFRSPAVSSSSLTLPAVWPRLSGRGAGDPGAGRACELGEGGGHGRAVDNHPRRLLRSLGRRLHGVVDCFERREYHREHGDGAGDRGGGRDRGSHRHGAGHIRAKRVAENRFFQGAAPISLRDEVW
jgi:hypothetical protein